MHLLEVKVVDILNAFVQVIIMEKVWTVWGQELVNYTRKVTLIVCTQYELKSAGTAFGSHFVSCMHELRYKSCSAYCYLRMQAALQPDHGAKYYSNALCYMDYILCVHYDAANLLQGLHIHFALKCDYVEPDLFHLTTLRPIMMPHSMIVHGA